jgi:hypothetical protein
LAWNVTYSVILSSRESRLESFRKSHLELGESNDGIKESLLTSVRLFVLEEAVQAQRISLQAAERYLPQLQVEEAKDDGYLRFIPTDNVSQKFRRIVRNPRHRFGIKAELNRVRLD